LIGHLLLRGAIACALALGLAGTASGQDGAKWVATWGTAQQLLQPPAAAQPAAAPPAAAPPAAPPPPATGPARRFGIPPRIAGLENQTVRMIARTSVGGEMVRVRLYNAAGGRALRIGAAHLAVRGGGSAIVAGTDRPLTFGGSPEITLYAGQTVVSDPVRLAVAPLTDLAVSLYLPGETGPPTTHLFGLRPTYISAPGNFAAAPEIADTARTTQSYYWLSGIDVLGGEDAAVVVNFGDSITDGDQSTPDTHGSWPALLARRLQADPATRHIGVVNAGISGNRLLGDNSSALVRLVNDVLTVPGVRWMTLLIGINDITGATRNPAQPALTAAEIVTGYRQIIALARLHGVQVIGGTLTPYAGSNVYNEAGEAIRSAVNEWIRGGGEFDAVIDFDAAVRDPRQPARFRVEADSPDLLHPGDAGYRLMADAIDLRLFR
jgi:lysophospholipase L1-like esterase